MSKAEMTSVKELSIVAKCTSKMRVFMEEGGLMRTSSLGEEFLSMGVYALAKDLTLGIDTLG